MNIFAKKMYSFVRFYISRFKSKDPSSPFTYIAIGDSTVEGTGATHPSKSYAGVIYSIIKEKFPKARYHNFGKFGSPTREVIMHQLDKAIALQPDLVTISVGANDIRDRVKIKTFQANLEHIIERLQRETNAKIVINTIPDFSKVPSVRFPYNKIGPIIINRYNKALENAASYYDVIFVDLAPHSKFYTKYYPEIIADDKFHPSDLGYALWANAIITEVADHIFPKGR